MRTLTQWKCFWCGHRSGSGTLNLTNCDMDVNSTSSSDAVDSGGACIFAQNINVGGGTSPTPSTGTGCTGGTIKYSGKYKTGTTTADPYASARSHLPYAVLRERLQSIRRTGTATLTPNSCVASGESLCSLTTATPYPPPERRTCRQAPTAAASSPEQRQSHSGRPRIFVMDRNKGFVVESGTPATTVTSTGGVDHFSHQPRNRQLRKIDVSGVEHRR